MPRRLPMPAVLATYAAVTVLASACGPDEVTSVPPKATTKQESNETAQKTAKTLPPLPPPPKDAKPLRLALSGMMDGHLEPCGCASAQAGGVDRRAFWLRLNQHRFDAKLEGGNSIHADDPLERQKLQWIQTILGGYLEYRYFPLGPRELALGKDELTLYTTDERGGPFVCSDLRIGGKPPFLTYAIQDAGAYKLCLVALAGSSATSFAEGASVLSADVAIREALEAAGTRGKDYHCVILFAHDGGPEAARRHAKTIAGLDLVLAWDHELETRSKPEVFRHDPKDAGVAQTTLLYPGWRGKNLLLWTGKPDAQGTWHTTALEKDVLQVPANAEKGKRPAGSDADVWSMLIASKQEIGELGLRERMAERTKRTDGLTYVGTTACGECHKSSAELWTQTKHAHAWKTLEEREAVDGWPVSKHPDCVLCHTVGYGEVSGFVNPAKTPDLEAVGCEVCHGPGSAHVDVMRALAARESTTGKKASSDELQKARADGKLQPADAKTCIRCHNFDQSPGFDFLERWPKIKHGLDR